MQIGKGRLQSLWFWHAGPAGVAVRACLALGLLAPAGIASAQTLARPGWAGSGLTVERWWPHAVLCEIRPDGLEQTAETTNGSTLHRFALRLDDLQTLGIDGVLLENLQTDAKPTTQSTQAVIAAIDTRYGTLDDFDQLVSDAVRHGMRVLVALRPGVHGQALSDDARFWLNRGVTGLVLASGEAADVRSLRTVLHGYVGERVLIADQTRDAGSASAPPTQANSGDRVRSRSASVSTRTDQPDLLRISLPPIEQGAAPMRSVIEQARAMLTAHAPVPLLASGNTASDTAAARVLATALLGSGGAVLLRAGDLDLAHAADPTPGSLFAWYRQWSGLHRGNAVMRSGDDTLLDHDADGALVWIRQSRGAHAPIVAICNVTGKPLRLSLTNDLQRLRLRGSFLRTLARSDGGMGAMPLREVALPPFGVYVGELSR